MSEWTDWIDWEGGDEPPDELSGCRQVQIRTRFGVSMLFFQSEIGDLRWSHIGRGADIMTYRYEPAFQSERDGKASEAEERQPLPNENQTALSTQVGGGHYKKLAIQPVEYIHANNLGFFEGSVVKYITRWRDKGGIEDLKKARHFIDLLVELEQRGATDEA